ncbi:protein-S-isoprenylcysteine O-methyltransferase [Martelella sp. HB161492]|uniref:protein-S-isoprenylcysteine O-methyltransferase n=1 Tax=Martelella sp. HB161492 TaxID=2720726 RepID=UPI0015903253|nr:protein-S-isoprenylcysteine O-methyltransferase [Martelella sp. HB161492]
MMVSLSFWCWLVLTLAWCALRYPAVRRALRTRIREKRADPLDIGLLTLCGLTLFAGPIAWFAGDLLPRFDRPQAIITLILGLATGAAFLWLFRRSHKDLGKNWSVTLTLREEHRLITRGVYAHIRHPMYASFMLWGISQALLVSNWIFGFAGLIAVILLYAIRLRREEAMMTAAFGTQYADYAARTKRLIPGIF